MKITKFRVNGEEALVAESALAGQLLPPRLLRMQAKFLRSRMTVPMRLQKRAQTKLSSFLSYGTITSKHIILRQNTKMLKLLLLPESQLYSKRMSRVIFMQIDSPMLTKTAVFTLREVLHTIILSIFVLQLSHIMLPMIEEQFTQMFGMTTFFRLSGIKEL